MQKEIHFELEGHLETERLVKVFGQKSQRRSTAPPPFQKASRKKGKGRKKGKRRGEKKPRSQDQMNINRTQRRKMYFWI